ncbi:MAG: hypothetical protein H7Y60_15965 [Rhodospirillaceae bacterium]|nr:hypothetical protein [Rhodospirillales bacterium]
MPDMDTGMERHRTDKGLTGDKIHMSDPSAAPMHTDAESAGTPTSRSAVMASIAQMMETTLKTPRPDTFGAWRHPEDVVQRRLGRVAMVWAVLVPVCVGLLAGWIGWP